VSTSRLQNSAALFAARTTSEQPLAGACAQLMRAGAALPLHLLALLQNMGNRTYDGCLIVSLKPYHGGGET
jgi:hypothetical protein